MKSNSKLILTAIVAILIGLTLGYWIFGNKQTPMSSHDGHDHESDAVQMADGEETIWTCSMHPQIRQNEPGLCPICEMDLIALESNTSNDPLVLEMTEAAVKLSNIQTTTIGTAAGEKGGKTIRLTGRVQADERQASSQVAHVPGRIEKLYVSFTGEQVRNGQKLADIYSPDLIAAQRELLEAKKLTEVSPGLLEAARNKLKYWKISDDIIQSIEESEEIRETFPLYANAGGVVTNRRVAVGDYVSQGQALFDLINLSKVWVIFDAYEEDLAIAQVGDRIEFTTPAIRNKTFTTRITFIDPLINVATRTASLRTEISNPRGLLKPEMLVTGTLTEKGTTNEQLLVPKSAVLWTGKRSVVYVKVPDTNIPSFQFREVVLGEAIGDNYQVVEGIETGEEVVTYGNFTIDAAAQLNNQASMMNREVVQKGLDQSEYLPDFTETTPPEFKQQLEAVTDSYLVLKDAFVATDPSIAADAANALLENLTKVDMTLLKDEPHMYWMEQLNAIQAHAKKITELTDVEAQRQQFDFLSQALINTVKVFGVAEDTLYVQHCPMAFDNEGADWLSDEEGIRNPYFGDKMMKCGIVKETIDENYKNEKQ